MADALITQVIDAARDLVARDHRDGGTYDLSTVDGVRVGRHPRPWLGDLACVAIERGPLVNEIAEDRLGPVPLGKVGRDLELTFRGWAPVTPGDAEEADTAAAALANDLVTALEGDRTLDGLVVQLRIEEVLTPTGVASSDGGGALAGCQVRARYLWRSTAGV